MRGRGFDYRRNFSPSSAFFPLSLYLVWAKAEEPHPVSIQGINRSGDSIDYYVLHRHMWVRQPNSMAMTQVLKSWTMALSLLRPAVKAQAQRKKKL